MIKVKICQADKLDIEQVSVEKYLLFYFWKLTN